MRRLFGCPDFISLTQKNYECLKKKVKIFTENKPVRGLRKKYNIHDVNWLNFIIKTNFASMCVTVINRVSRENDDPLLSTDKVLSMSSCHRNSICHKGRIVSWFALSLCPVVTIIELSYPQCTQYTCGWHTCLSSVQCEALIVQCICIKINY